MARPSVIPGGRHNTIQETHGMLLAKALEDCAAGR
jgi:hypothetical protein